MAARRRYAITFVVLILLYFVPALPRVSEFLRNFFAYAIALYWLVLALLAVILGFKAVEGVER